MFAAAARKDERWKPALSCLVSPPPVFGQHVVSGSRLLQTAGFKVTSADHIFVFAAVHQKAEAEQTLFSCCIYVSFIYADVTFA